MFAGPSPVLICQLIASFLFAAFSATASIFRGIREIVLRFDATSHAPRLIVVSRFINADPAPRDGSTWWIISQD
jgi:hypothetical protein